jgi:putative ABC transport system permease protein
VKRKVFLTILINKTTRDIKSKKGQSLLIILAVAASAAGLSGVFNTLQNIETSISEEYAATNQAEIIVTTDAFPLSALSHVVSCPSVSDAEMRILANTNLLTDSRAEPFVLVGVKRFSDMHVNRIQLLEGHYPEKNEIMLEISSAELLDAVIGSRVTLRSVREPVTLTVSGLGRNPEFVSSSFSGTMVGYTDMETASAVTGVTGGNALYISPVSPGSDIDDVLKVLTDNGWYAVSVDRRSAYSGSEIVMGTLLLVFMLSLFMLIIAIIFLLVLLSSLVSEQTEEIKNMRMLGIENFKIVNMYGFHGIILGSVGAVLGVFLGYGITRSLYLFFAEDVLNVEPDIHYNIGISLAIALVVSVTATLFWSLLLLRRRTYAPAKPGSLKSQSFWNKASLLFPLSVRMALRDFAQFRWSFIFMVVALALTATAFMCVQSLGTSIQWTLQTTLLDNRNYDVSVSFNSPVSQEIQQQLTEKIQTIPGVRAMEGWFFFEATVETESIGVFGVPPDSVVYSPDMVEGEWFSSPYAPGDCIISEYLSEMIPAAMGDTLVIEAPTGDVELTIRGIVRDADHDGKGVFIPLETAQRIMYRPGSITRLFIKTDAKNVGDVMTSVDAAISSLGISRVMRTKEELQSQTQQMKQTLLILLYGVTLCVVGACVAVILYVFSNLIYFKMNDIMNLKLAGLQNRNLAAFFFLESGIIVLLAWAVSCVIGVPLSASFIGLVRQIMLPVDFFFSHVLFLVNFLFIGAVMFIGIVPPIYRMCSLKTEVLHEAV